MVKMTYKFLHLANYKDIPNWSVQYADDEDLGFTKKYPMARIGAFLVKSKDIIEVEDDVEYKQVTIKINNGGVVPRNNGETILGSKIGTKRQHVVHAGQFIMSKIDARNGAYGIVPAELEGAIVTNDFPVFDVDTSKIIPQFLVLVSTTEKFIEFARKCSSGTTNRKRIDIEAFLNQQIPLPSKEEQEKILEEYNNKIQRSKQKVEELQSIPNKIAIYLQENLGIKDSKSQTEKLGLLMFVQLAKLIEWGVEFNKETKNKISSDYPIYKVKDLCKVGSGGTPSRTTKKYYDGNIPWIKTGEVLNNIILDTEEKITQEAIANSSAKLFPKGSLIMAMYGQGETRGRTAKLGIDAATNQACAVLYGINNSMVLTDYLWYYLQFRYDDIRSMASGNNQPNLNAEKIKNYDIVVPPISKQMQLIDYVKSLKDKQEQLKALSTELISTAYKEFEQRIFE
jgi:restriction endonuclease S subunit